MRRTRKAYRHGDRGAAAVEFALIALILVTILFGIFEGGRLWMIQSSLSQAAREGAREMAIHDKPDDAKTVISARSAMLGVVVVPTITVVPGANPPATCVVEATASAEVSTMTGVLDFAIPGGTIPLTGKADMRCGG